MAVSCTPPEAEAHETPTEAVAHITEVTGHRVSIAEIRWCRMVGDGARFVGCLHASEGHHQGQRGHLWADYQRQARQLRRFINSVNCTGDVICIERRAAAEFGVPADDFVRVIGCESGHNPLAVNSSSGALGLGQHLPRYWGARAAALGYTYGDWSDARANARVSAWLWATSGPQHWVCY